MRTLFLCFRFSPPSSPVTKAENGDLSCSVTPQDCSRFKVRWLYDGKSKLLHECSQTITMCQECGDSFQEELFSCEVSSPVGPDEVRVFPLRRQSEGQTRTIKLKSVSF